MTTIFSSSSSKWDSRSKNTWLLHKTS